MAGLEIDISHNLVYKTRILRERRSDRGVSKNSFINRMDLWQSISYRRVKSAIIQKIRILSVIICMFVFISHSFY